MRRHSTSRRRLIALALLFAGVAQQVNAGVVIAGTRVVYPSDARDVNVRLINSGDAPSLVQVWLDSGNPSASPESIKVPFILTPPLARIDPNKSQTLRMVYTGEALPQDKESLFWMNMLEVPPKPKDSENSLQFATRTRIKVFYRPKQLTGNAFDAGALVEWSASGTGSSKVIEAKNPSPYFVNLVQIRLLSGDKELGKASSLTLAPGTTEKVTFADADLSSATPSMVRFQLIDDYGALRDGERRLLSK